MQALQLSKKTTTFSSRAIFLAASSFSFPCRTLTTFRPSPLPSPACHSDTNRGAHTWLSLTTSNLLLRSPWSVTQHRGIKVSGSDVKVGNVIEKKGRIYQVVKTDHSHEGRGKATIKVELRDIESGNKVSQRLGTDENVEKVYVREETYMYMCTERSGTIVLMNVETFDQLEVSQELFGKDAIYLQGEMKVTVRLYDDTPLSVSVPKRVTCIVKEAQTAVGVGASLKERKVVLDNGMTLEVPGFVVAGDAVVINTETDSYIERA